MTLASYLAWKAAARPRERYEYHRGRLVHDAVANLDIAVLRDEVVKAWLTGNYELAQVRVGKTPEFSYFIIRRLTHDPVFRYWILPSEDRRSPHREPPHYRRAA